MQQASKADADAHVMVVRTSQASAAAVCFRVRDLYHNIGGRLPLVQPLSTRPDHKRQVGTMAPVDWLSLPPEHNIAKFAAGLPGILKETGHYEMYGVELEAPSEGYEYKYYPV